MATLDATVGGPTSNSYVTLAEANAFFDASYARTAWTNVVPADAVKETLLMEATRLIDTFFVFNGLPTSLTQSLQWPRIGATDENRETIADDEVPTRIKNATIEFAYHLLQNGPLVLNEIEFDKIKVASIQIDFNKMTAASGFPKVVRDMLSPLGSCLIAANNGISQARLIRT